MWSLIKTCTSLVVLAALAYVVFFVPLGGATLSEHAREVWSSAVVQDKVQKVREGVTQELAEHFEKQLPTKREAVAKAKEKLQHDISEADRKALDSLLSDSLDD